LKNPTHTYSAVGTYSPVLTVTNTAGSDSKTRNNYITIAGTAWDSTVNATNFDFTALGGINDRVATRNAGSAGNNEIALSSLDHSGSGKYYAEVLIGGVVASTIIGVAVAAVNLHTFLGQNANGWAYAFSGNKANGAGFGAYGAAFVAGDVIGIMVDFDTPELRFTKNGVDQGVAFTNINGKTLLIAVSDDTVGNNFSLSTVASEFAFPIPAGYSEWG